MQAGASVRAQLAVCGGEICTWRNMCCPAVCGACSLHCCTIYSKTLLSSTTVLDLCGWRLAARPGTGG